MKKTLIIATIFAVMAATVILYRNSQANNSKINECENILGSSMTGDVHATSTDGKVYATQDFVTVVTTTPPTETPTGDANIGAFVLGSVTITSTTPGSLAIHNATSTTDKASTTVAHFDNDGSDIAAGTYEFNALMDRGIMFEFVPEGGTANFTGAYTITWR